MIIKQFKGQYTAIDKSHETDASAAVQRSNLAAVQSSKVQSDLEAGSNSSRCSNRSTVALRSKRSQTALIFHIASCREAYAGWMFFRR
jgi:hypothetical protein